MYVYVYEEIHFQELARVITEASESKICSAGWWAGDPGEPRAQMMSKAFG